MLNLLTLQHSDNVMEAVRTGFLSWGLLALGLGILFVLLVILSKITGKKDRKDK